MRSSTIVLALLAILLLGSISTYSETIVTGHITERPLGGDFLLATTNYTLDGSFRGDTDAVWSFTPYRIGDTAYIGFYFSGPDVGGTGFTIIDGTRYDFYYWNLYPYPYPSASIQMSAPPIVIGGAGLYSGPFTLTGRFHGTFFDDPIPWHTDIQGEFTGTGIATLTVIPSAPQPDGSPGFKVTGISYEFTTSVPEPSSILLLCIGLGAVGLIVWRRGN